MLSDRLTVDRVQVGSGADRFSLGPAAANVRVICESDPGDWQIELIRRPTSALINLHPFTGSKKKPRPGQRTEGECSGQGFKVSGSGKKKKKLLNDLISAD